MQPTTTTEPSRAKCVRIRRKHFAPQALFRTRARKHIAAIPTKNDYPRLTAKPAQVAEMLGYEDVKSVYGLIRTGKIRVRKVGNTFLVNLTSVREFAGEE